MKYFFLLILVYCKINSSIEVNLKSYPADGISGGKIILHHSIFSKDEFLNLESDLWNRIKVENFSDKQIIYFQSTNKSGILKLKTKEGNFLDLEFYETILDSDEDGIPDIAELKTESDREAFRDWFVRIAESQYFHSDAFWNLNERDCSGLVRYSYKEALKLHDESWFVKNSLVLDKNLKDIEAFHYPYVPILGENIFKINHSDANDKTSFGKFADAENLWNLNTKFVSKKLFDAKKADLVFFENKKQIKYPFHTMIITEGESTDPILIYHTGEKSILKRIKSSYLKKNPIFNLSETNHHYLGIYRFKILE